MLNNKNIRIIISLVAAIVLWIYVVGAVDPTTVKQIRGVPISVLHTAELGERGLAVGEMELETIDIRVSGDRSTLNALENTDIAARVDLASASKGENNLPIKVVGVLNGVEVQDISSSSVNVTVEDLVKENRDVAIHYGGEFADGEGGYTIETAIGQVEIRGAESKIALVEKVNANIQAEELEAEPKDYLCDLIPVDKDNNVVTGISLSHSVSMIKAVKSITKPVDLNVTVVDESTDKLVREVDVPNTVTLTGRADVLEKISKVEAEQITVTGLTADTDLPIKLKLEDGVNVVEGEAAPVAKLSISELQTKTITYGVGDINLTGRQESTEYKIAEGTEVIVTIRDSEKNLGDISKADITLSVDVSALNDGTSSATITMNASKAARSIEFAPDRVDITVEKTTQVED